MNQKGMVAPVKKTTLHLEFKTPSLRAKLRRLCNGVVEQFLKLPSLRLLCYFDDEYPEELRQQLTLWGVTTPFTGIHTPIIGSGTLPNYVRRLFFDYSSGDFAFDNLIYLPGTKYVEDDVALVIVFAHELQHFVQWGFARKVSQASTLLYWNLAQFDPNTDLKPWQLPNNVDAMIVAMRVAETVCGTEAVRAFVDKQVAEGKVEKNISKTELWTWVRTLSPVCLLYTSPSPRD